MKYFETEWLLRILSALLMGSLIGYERHSRSKEAGVRTHAVVAVAACVLMLISRYAFPDAAKNDPARIAAQVVSGVSFLGAGIIFVNKGTIQGLTTAAGIWATAAIGMCFGTGMYVIGFFTGILIFCIQMLFPKIFRYSPPRNLMKITVHLSTEGTANTVNRLLDRMSLNHSENSLSSDGKGSWYVKTEISTHSDIDPDQIVSEMKKDPQVLDVTIEE